MPQTSRITFLAGGLAVEVVIVLQLLYMSSSRYMFFMAAAIALAVTVIAFLFGGHGRGLLLAGIWLASGIAMGRVIYREPYVGEGAGLSLFMLVAALLGVAILFDKTTGARLRADHSVVLALAAYMVGTLLISMRPVTLNLGMVFYEELLWATRLGVLVVISYWVAAETDVRSFWNGAYLVVALEAVATVLQPLGINLLNLLVPQVELVSTYAEGLRGGGMLSGYTNLGNYMAVITPLVFAAFLGEEGKRRWLSLIALALALLTLYLSFTRTAWIAAACGVLAVVVTMRVKHIGMEAAQKRWLRWLIALVFVFVLSVWPYAVEHFMVQGDSVTVREVANELALQMLKDTSFLGVGLHNYLPTLVTSYYPYYRSGITFEVHNTFLLVLAETGIVGFLLFWWLIIAIGRSLLATVGVATCKPARYTSLGAIGSMVAFLVAGLGNMTIRYEPATNVLWLIIAAGLAGAWVARNEKT